MFEPTFQQARCLFPLCFDVGNVGYVCAREGASIVNHALQHKGRDSVVSPSMLKSEAFDNHQRKIVFVGQTNGVFEGMIPLCAPRGRHPINDDIAVFVGDTVNL